MYNYHDKEISTSIGQMYSNTWDRIDYVNTNYLSYTQNAQNSFKCSAETYRQNKIWSASCEFCPNEKQVGFESALYTIMI